MKNLAAAVFLATGLTACAPTLAGQLHDPAGRPVTATDARVNITRVTADAPGGVVAVVDDDGHFATDAELPAGDYLVEALVPGYAAASRRITLADHATVDLTLKPLPRAKTRATHANTAVDEGRGAGGALLMPPSL